MKPTELKEVLHLYLGCECIVTESEFYEGGKGILVSFDIEVDAGVVSDCNAHDQTKYCTEADLDDIKPILRTLDSMTLEEGAWCLKETFFDHVDYPLMHFKLELVGEEQKNPRISIDNDWFKNELTFGTARGSIWSCDTEAANVKITSKVWLYLLSKHFDLFGLIESGQALNRDKE